MTARSEGLTTLLFEWRQGDPDAGRRLMTEVYEALRGLAAAYFRRERRGHTLQPTALVHELYMRLFGSDTVEWRNTAHFFAVAAQQLRRILVDHARSAQAAKRGGKRVRLSLTQAEGWLQQSDQDLLEVDEALRRLEELDPRAAKVVELRFFAGLKEEETAEVLDISLSTLHRDWKFARAWLISQLMPSDRSASSTC